jgi:hypothetical protein
VKCEFKGKTNRRVLLEKPSEEMKEECFSLHLS